MPTLLVDYREGSKDLLAPLLAMGLPCEESDLATGGDSQNAADLAFVGRGEKGVGVMVGIEHKKLADLSSSLRTKRINEQARKMQTDYQFRYLIVEGDLMIDDRGHLLKRAGWRSMKAIEGVSAPELFKRVFVLQLTMGLTPLFVPTRRVALKAIEYLYRVWTDQDLDQHKSHLDVYEPPTIVPPTDFVRTVRTFPECGLKVAGAAEGEFGSIRAAVNAGARAWANVTTRDRHGNTRRFGESNAQKVVTYVTKEGTRARKVT